jgi:hypothetical protein
MVLEIKVFNKDYDNLQHLDRISKPPTNIAYVNDSENTINPTTERDNKKLFQSEEHLRQRSPKKWGEILRHKKEHGNIV